MKNFAFLFISIFFSGQIYAQSDLVTGTDAPYQDSMRVYFT